MRTGQGFLCVYSITNKGSFDEISSFREQILRVKDADKVPMVVVGNKLDLDSERAVSREEGKEFAADLNCPWMETSAKARIRVEDAFYELVRPPSRDACARPALDCSARGAGARDPEGAGFRCQKEPGQKEEGRLEVRHLVSEESPSSSLAGPPGGRHGAASPSRCEVARAATYLGRAWGGGHGSRLQMERGPRSFVCVGRACVVGWLAPGTLGAAEPLA